MLLSGKKRRFSEIILSVITLVLLFTTSCSTKNELVKEEGVHKFDSSVNISENDTECREIRYEVKYPSDKYLEENDEVELNSRRGNYIFEISCNYKRDGRGKLPMLEGGVKKSETPLMAGIKDYEIGDFAFKTDDGELSFFDGKEVALNGALVGWIFINIIMNEDEINKISKTEKLKVIRGENEFEIPYEDRRLARKALEL